MDSTDRDFAIEQTLKALFGPLRKVGPSPVTLQAPMNHKDHEGQACQPPHRGSQQPAAKAPRPFPPGFPGLLGRFSS